jgi:DNA-binding response OmpR family regulator
LAFFQSDEPVTLEMLVPPMAQDDTPRSIPSLKVLVVEDEPLLAMELEGHLRELGQEVIGLAEDAEQALALASGAGPQLALVDLNLRDGLTGPQIARALVEQYGTIVVFVTASPGQIPDDYAGALGALVKPCDPMSISQLIAFVNARRPSEHTVRIAEPPAAMILAPQFRG